MEKITPLSGSDWSADAALASALESVNPKNPCLVMWLDENDELHWRAANMKLKDAAFMAARTVDLVNNSDEAETTDGQG